MAKFGWAYISGSNAGGVDDSIQIKKSQELTGSSKFTYNIASSTVALTGTLNVSGAINANAFNLDVTNKNVTNLSITGSSKFGDTADDVHQFTGSIKGTGALSASAATFSTLVGTSLNLQTGGITNAGSIAGATTVSGTAGTFTTLGGTSLALQNGGITNAGSIGGATTGTFSSTVTGAAGTFEAITGTSLNLQTGGITNAGSIAGGTTGTFSSTVSGAAGTFTTLAGTSLALQGGGVTATGPIAGATTISASSNLQVGGSITGSSINLTGLAAGTALTSSYLALDASKNVILTSSVGGAGGAGGTIGAPEDSGSPNGYVDGLFTDFTEDTTIGTAVDRFNEVLKILSPSPAPVISKMNEDVTDGVSAKLSFGASYPVTEYTSSGTGGGFSAVDRTGIYAADTSGDNIRLGVYDKTQDITGFVNHHVVESITNTYMAYSNKAFNNANEGTLKLELNGTVVHSVALSGLTGAGLPNSGSGTSLTGQSGFTNVSTVVSSRDGNNAEWYIFKYRTVKYKIAAADQRVGWNYLRVVHSLSTDNATNYVEWVNDPSGAVNDLAISNPRIEDITLVGSKYLSGVEYNTDATAKYKADIQNLYRNVYASSGTPISFTVGNSAPPAAQEVLDIAASENNTKVLGVTASLDFNGSTLFNGAITCNTTVTHPLKNTISNQGSATTGNGFLIDNRTLASTRDVEKFHDETYRKTSGSYDTQNSMHVAAALWNSQNHMTGGGASGHTDGLLFHNQRLYSPVDGDVPNGGNFEAIANNETNQPNYSGITGDRTFYRIVSNSSGVAKRDMKIVSTKNSTIYNDSSLAASNVHFFAKIPGSTGWMDISQNFVYGSTSDGDGALINGAANDVDSGDNTHFVTFGTQSVANNDSVMIKIVADESWSGYISQLSFSVGATTNTATQAFKLDNIDANNSGVDAKLSFGSSNGITNYSNATGSSISLTNFDSNASYTLSGNRRGVLSSKQTIIGTLNEDIVASGKNYDVDSFRDAYTGSLTLEVNGIDVHTINLESSLSEISSSNGNTSGFIVSSASFSTTTDNIPDYTKPYRTGSYYVGPAEQNLGWNYARVKHVAVDGVLTSSNYVEWIVDTDNNALAAGNVALSTFDHLDKYYQSGVGYFASRPSASYTYEASNVYRNIYSNEASLALQFPTTTRCSISNIRIVGTGITTFDSAVANTGLPNLNNSSNCEQQLIQVTGTVLFDDLTSISGGIASIFTDYDVSVNSAIHHPLKSDLTSSTQSKTSFMVYSGSIGSTSLTTNEYFGLETYRIVSGNYANQTDVTNSGNTWNSQTALNGANVHGDGMVTANGFAVSPLMIGNAGDTRNNADGGNLQAPSGNPNYSTLSDSIRTYYRYFRNTTGLAKPTFSISLYGDANLISKSGASYTGTLGANKNIQVELKVPFDSGFTGPDDTSTAWADCIKPYSAGVQPITDGIGINNNGGALDQTVDSGGTTIQLQLLEKQVRNNQYFVLKISAHKEWTGYLSRILINY
tara:strand:+ start:263 stop:4741 length:4479 start_codon:yes stop_codon:yes gene_type:complete